MSHLVFASYEIAPTTAGGVGIFIFSVCEVLLQEGHRVSLLLDLPSDEFNRWIDKDSLRLADRNGLRSHLVEELCRDVSTDRSSFPSESHWRSFRLAHALAKLHSEAPVDFAEFFDYCGPAYYSLVGRAAEPRRFPPRIAIRLHNTIEIIDRRTNAEFASDRVYDYTLERAALGLADLVLSPGQRYWDDECASLYPFVSPARVQLSALPRQALSRVAGSGQGRDIVFVGRLSTFKGLDKFLHAVVTIIESPALDHLVRRFVVIGPGEHVSSSQNEKELLSIADGVPPDRLLFAGRLSEDGMRKHFAEAAVAVFPNRIESFCYAAHEAHLAGVPLILSDTPAFRDHFIDGESALFFDGTVGGLVAQIRRCLADPSLRAHLSASVELRRDRYRQHGYNRHLAIGGFAASVRVRPEATGGLGIVVVPSDDDLAAVSTTAQELAQALPAATIWQLAPASGERGQIRAFAQTWRILDLSGSTVAAGSQMLPPAVAFVAGGAAKAAPFFGAAERMLRNEPRLGAVLPACADAYGMCRASAVPSRLEYVHEALLSAVVRVSKRATLADMLEDGSELTEMTALLRHRATGAILVDHPTLGPVKPALVDSVRASAARARMLRAYAWSADRVALADALADLATLAARLHPVEMRRLGAEPWPLPVPAGSFVLQVREGIGAGSRPNRVTVLSLRRWHDAPMVEAAELRLAGHWRHIDVRDRANPMLVSEGGQLEVPGAIDPQVTLLLGPDQGIAVIAFAGSALRLDLYHTALWAMTVRASDLFALCQASDQIEPQLPATILLHGAAWDDVSSGLGPDGRHLDVLESPVDRLLAEAMGAIAAGTNKAWTPPEGVYTGLAAAARTIATRMAAGVPSHISVFGGAPLLPLLDGLLQHCPMASISYTLRPVLGWQAGGWEWLRATAQIAARYPGRLKLRAAPGAALEALRVLGAAVECADVTLPSPGVRPPPGPVNLVLPVPSGSVPSLGHIIIAVAEVMRADAAGRVFVPRAQPHTIRILEEFGAGLRVDVYDDVEMLLEGLSGSRFIYCCPFADASVDVVALQALRRGGLVVVAPGPLVFSDPKVRQILEVTFWEDSMHIATHLRTAMACYDQLLNQLGAPALAAPPPAAHDP